MTRLRILFDADDVAEDLIGNWVLAVNEKYGTAVTPEDVRDWDITKAFPTLTREQILNQVWGYSYIGETNVVDVYIRYLRSKIDETFDEKFIHTIRGVGYYVKEE